MPAQGTGTLKTQGGRPRRDTGCAESPPADRNVSTEPDDTRPRKADTRSGHTQKKVPSQMCQRNTGDDKCQMRSNQDPAGSCALPVMKVRPERCAQFQTHGRRWGSQPAELTATSRARGPARTVCAYGCRYRHVAQHGFFQDSDLATYSPECARTGKSRDSEPSRKLFYRNY